MMPIDFEKKFTEFLEEYKLNNDAEDEDIGDVVELLFDEWMDTPAEWLGGKMPEEYFESFDAAKSIEVLGEYIFSGIKIPAMLYGRILEIKVEAYPYILNLIKNYEGEKSDELKAVLVELIDEMEMAHPYEFYIKVISEAEEEKEFPEVCVRELKDTGNKYKEKIIDAYENAKNDYAADCFLDILSDIPYDERTYNYALEKLQYGNEKKAFYASCLGKIGNGSAITVLEEAINDPKLKYFEYMAIRNSIEELGGEVTIERDFEGDKDYEMLKNLGDLTND